MESAGILADRPRAGLALRAEMLAAAGEDALAEALAADRLAVAEPAGLKEEGMPGIDFECGRGKRRPIGRWGTGNLFDLFVHKTAGNSPFDSPVATRDSGLVKMGPRVIGGLLLVVGAVLGWWQFAKSGHPAGGVPPDAGHGSAVVGTAKFPEDARAKLPRHKTSGRATGPDSVARYFRADEAGRRAIIEGWADRAGKGTSPDDAVERLADLHAKESDPALREEILDSLVWIASGTAFDSILGILRDATDDEQRDAAATALGSVIPDLADAGDWERVARGLEADLPTALRVATVETLMTEGNAAAIPRLQELLGDPDPEIREAAERAVEALTEPP
jgi:hypothetical protein